MKQEFGLGEVECAERDFIAMENVVELLKVGVCHY